MLTEFTSFFDNFDVLYKIKHIWSKFQQPVYENDSISFESACHKICRKKKKLKPISIQLGQEQMYLFKDKSPHGMLQLTVVIMSIYKTDYGKAIRLKRNGQYIDLITSDPNVLKQLLQQKCLQTTFHDDFTVSKMIGKGSFAKVYLAAKKSTGVQFAIKAFNKEFMQEQFRGKESLENEIRVMRRLNQENLVHLHEAYETQNSIYFVLDLLEGGELFARAKISPYSTECLQKLMYNFLKALLHIHSRKCIHRDLKPENLLLRTQEYPTDIVIADLGLATFLNEQIIFKRCGTPGFVAPEILIYKQDDPFYDDKCDIFSAGVIFYILLTGKQPFQGSDYKTILRSNKNCEINFNIKQIQQSSQQLQELLRKMLQQNPKDRPNAEACLQHPYFKEIFDKNDLIEIHENLNEQNQRLLLKKGSFESQVGSMELITRSPVLNGRIDSVGSLSYGSVLGSSTRLEKPQLHQQQYQSKFSQFCQNMKNVQQDQNGSPLASPLNKRKDSQDLHKFALKNSYQQKQLSKDDEDVNEEQTHLESSIQKLNSQSSKIGLLKKSASFQGPKTIQE
ncbi:unnamed protein product (macronuclear) [Paramecium tetraurelia]|uniref:Protein kinase domain-containing protein n=1 Tax=Paramecium tetraurelia TaxID=5888 RepID=A0BU39_PARTE|nr:uncharacterized protein GSPATT00032288001 [Paramecium tetraurelia]CAK62056.1 unnamed protein product [Paramecium tetraurelia]|eukprot:XP_001429454.1 hypothetical protein (macronuclear) [Paramecium tetraurelia strain d4-2]